MRNMLGGLIFSVLAFVIVAVPTYILLWHRAGLDSVKPEDGPGAAMGAFPVVVSTIAVSSFVAIATFVVTLVIGIRRHRSHSEGGV
jgi:hypothetical protein